MRKIAMTGLALVLVMFLMTCDQFFLDEDGPEAEYTDVVYSQDGDTIAITVYLDGETVPVTKNQRAMTRDLARMAYDFFEVIFIGPNPDEAPGSGLPEMPIARSSWELGQGAGISGVYRGPAGAGHNYAWIPPEDRDGDPEFYDRSIALIFVGRKDGRTLFGVGRIGDVDHVVADRVDLDNEPREDVYLADGFPITPVTIITDESKSVTFYVTAVKTGLLVGNEGVSTSEEPEDWENPYNIKADSFNFVQEAGITDKDGNRKDSTVPDWERAKHSSRSPLGSYNYPMYSLPMRKDTLDGKTYPYQNAEYTFWGAADQYKNEIKLNQSVASGAITVEKRFPRYVQGGRYYQPKENIDSDTILKFDDVKYGDLAKDDPINNVIPLNFQTTVGMGIFSFYIEMPVYMITKKPSTNGVLEAEVWKIRTGFGSELYSLDTGKSSGGCVLIGVGVTSLDWLEIEWGWIGNAPAIPDVPDVP
jgi:hypothetical protein